MNGKNMLKQLTTKMVECVEELEDCEELEENIFNLLEEAYSYGFELGLKQGLNPAKEID